MQSRTSSSHDPSPITASEAPRKEEWAIINKYKALEFERMKQQEIMVDRQKKEQFRRQLDIQLNSRNNAELKEKYEDRMYYQRLAENAELQKQREEAEKMKRFMNRKNIDESNVGKMESRSRVTDGDTGYHLEIGVQSEKEHIEKAQVFKKDMMDTLDLQLRQKSEQQKLTKIRNIQLEQAHKKIQQNYFKPEQRRHYSQNQRIYDYFQQIENDRLVKQQDLEHKFVIQAKMRRERAQVQRERQERQHKMNTMVKVKQTLGQQVQQLRQKRVQQQTTNPQQLNFKFIEGIFQPKYQGYDKNKYKQQLQKQVQQNRMRKLHQNHMNQQQYKLNMNQLSKAVMGNFAQQNYLDRSLGAIGEKYQIDKVDSSIQDDDVDIIKSRIKNLRHRGNMSTIL